MTRAFIFIGVLVLGYSSSWACSWDSDTLRDEAVAHPSRFDILIGQFAHHGEKYYEHRVSQLAPKDGLSIVEQNDLAVAYMRLGEFANADGIWESIIEEDPEYYPAISNMGVSAKKQGDFTRAAEFIRRALEINPEGHLGIGDWYLRMLEWRAEDGEDGVFIPSEEVSGEILYWTDYAANSELVRHNYDKERLEWNHFLSPNELFADGDKNIERLFQLLKNDQTFADGFFMLGMALTKKGDFHLSSIAFARAKELGHSKAAEWDGRMTVSSDEHWWYQSAYTQKELDGLFREGEKWKDKYSKEEARILRKGHHPTFAYMKANTSIHSKKYLPEQETNWDEIGMILLFIGAFVLLVLLVGIPFLLFFLHLRRNVGTRIDGSSN